MKKLFTRFLAFVIMLTYIGTNILIPNLQVYADDLDSFDLTNLQQSNKLLHIITRMKPPYAVLWTNC